ncbi:MAG TPA: hypothetical protein VL181_04570 [Holophagaceae bacterium]|nr:hypothetical protein [Holophagaceae bacterium]
MNPHGQPQTIARRLLGLLAGWLCCVSLVATVEGFLRQAPMPVPTAWITPGAALLAAMAGGYLCAFISKDRTMPKVLIAAVLISGLAYGASPAAGADAKPLLLAIMGAVGVYLGAWLRDG